MDFALGFVLASVVALAAIRGQRRTIVRGWERAGTVGVDAGLVMLVDPCYVLHRDEIKVCGHVAREGGLDPAFGRDWADFCGNVLTEQGPEGYPIPKVVTQIQSKEEGSWCSAVVVGGFGGDGRYPVYVRRDGRGLVEAVMVVFNHHEGEPPLVQGSRSSKATEGSA